MTLEQLSAELKPCPFCGATIEMAYWEGHWGLAHPAQTDRCLMEGDFYDYDSRYEATLAWNTRTGQLVAVQADDADKKMYLCKEHSHWYSYGQDCPLCSAALATKGDA